MAALDAALQELLRNDKEHSTVALSTVQKIVNNILSHQDEPRYRRLRAENKAIKEKLLGVVGGGALLAALGFAAQGDELVLPMESSPVKLLQVRREPRLEPRSLRLPASSALPGDPSSASAPGCLPCAVSHCDRRRAHAADQPARANGCACRTGRTGRTGRAGRAGRARARADGGGRGGSCGLPGGRDGRGRRPGRRDCALAARRAARGARR